MKSINELFRFIQRKRHAAGYGVHSQFAFELIKDTIHTPYSYYIYEDNKNIIKKSGFTGVVDLKYAELLFRLVNRFNTKKILEIGSGLGINTLYLRGHSTASTVTCIEINNDKLKKAELLLANKIKNIILTNVLTTEESNFDAIVWDLEQYSYNKRKVIDIIEKAINPDGFVVINYINIGKENKEIWQKILKLNQLTMSFDLGAVGIGFFKPGLPKLNYEVYF